MNYDHRIVSLKCKPEDMEAFRLWLRESFLRLRQVPGCRSLQIVSDMADSTSFYTIGTWHDVEAPETYRTSPLFKGICPRVKTFLREPVWVSTCEKIE